MSASAQFVSVRLQSALSAAILSHCSEGDVSKGFTWATDNNSWAKYEHIAVDCVSSCTLSVRFRSSTNSTFGPQPLQKSPVRLALAVGAPLEDQEVAVLYAAESDHWVLLNTTVTDKSGLLKSSGEAGVTLFLRLSHQCEVDYFFLSTSS